MILVTGAGGKTGKAVIQSLSGKGAVVRAWVRREEQVPGIRELGAIQVLVGDLLDEAAFRRSMVGVRKVYHVCPNVHPKEVEIGKIAIEAAQAAGVEHFVFHSVLHPQIEPMPHHWLKMRVEEMLLASKLRWTFLRPSVYMQNIGGQWAKLRSEGRYEVPYSLDTRLSLVDLEEVAEAAARVLTEKGHEFAAYDLCSEDAPDQCAIAELLGKAAGRNVEAIQVSIEEWDRNAEKAGLGDYARETLIKMFRYYEQGHLLGNPGALQNLLGREPNTLDEYLKGFK